MLKGPDLSPRALARYIVCLLLSIALVSAAACWLLGLFPGRCAYGRTYGLCKRKPTCKPEQVYNENWECVASPCYGRCKNGGVCDGATGICQCPPNTIGPDCGGFSCPPGEDGASFCSNDGTCARDVDGTPYCICNAGGSGPYCEIEV